MHIAIAGNIGSGKTTLTKLLAHRYEMIDAHIQLYKALGGGMDKQ